MANEPSLLDKDGTPAKTHKNKTNFHSHESKAIETEDTEPGLFSFPIVHTDELSENAECPKEVIKPTATPNYPDAGTFDVPQLSNLSSIDNIGSVVQSLNPDTYIQSHDVEQPTESNSETSGNDATAVSTSDTSTASNPSNNA